MGFNISGLWKIQTPQANEANDPPLRYKDMIADIESRAGGAAQIVANLAARNAIPPAQLYNGKRVTQLNDRSEWEWSGSAWLMLREDTGWVDVTVNSGFAAQSTSERPRIRRIGRQVTLMGNWAGTGITAINTNYSVGQIPTGQGLIPALMTGMYPAGTPNGAITAQVQLTAGGGIHLRTGATLAAYYSTNGINFLSD